MPFDDVLRLFRSIILLWAFDVRIIRVLFKHGAFPSLPSRKTFLATLKRSTSKAGVGACEVTRGETFKNDAPTGLKRKHEPNDDGSKKTNKHWGWWPRKVSVSWHPWMQWPHIYLRQCSTSANALPFNWRRRNKARERPLEERSSLQQNFCFHAEQRRMLLKVLRAAGFVRGVLSCCTYCRTKTRAFFCCCRIRINGLPLCRDASKIATFIVSPSGLHPASGGFCEGNNASDKSSTAETLTCRK